MELIPHRHAPSTSGGELAPHKPGAEVGGSTTRVLHAVTTFSKPRWLAVHLLVAALAITMVLLGRWQLTVSDRKHFDLQNFGYALQWWAFTAFGLFMWVKIMRDHLRRDSAPPPSSTSGIVLPTDADGSAAGGPAWLATRSTQPGQSPTVYRGYVMPSSADVPAGSDGDGYHATYNDYLWQLALADSAGGSPPDRPAAGREPRREVEAGTAGPAHPAPGGEDEPVPPPTAG